MDFPRDPAEKLDRAMVLLHQFGKDLAWIRTLASRLERPGASPNPREKASAIRKISEEMRESVRGFLRPRAESSVAPLTAIVEGALRTVQRSHPLCRVATVIREEATELAADEPVGHLLSNLLDNAAEASPHGAVIGLAVASVDGAIRIEVSDEGRGMEPSTLAQCFERGFTTKATTGGTGTGLYASRRIAVSIGGGLELHSSPGEGTVATLTVPACALSGGRQPGQAFRLRGGEAAL